MDEVGLVDGIVEAVQRRAGDRPVARFRVRIGTLHRASQGPMDGGDDVGVMGAACGSTAIDHEGGDELVLESIEYAAPAVAVPAAG